MVLVYSTYFLASQSLVVYLLLLGAAVLLLVQLLAELINWYAWKQACFCALFLRVENELMKTGCFLWFLYMME